jgi:hypothetical protein
LAVLGLNFERSPPMSIAVPPAAPRNESAPTYSRTPLPDYPYWAPRFWHGMRLSTWLRLLWQNRCAVSPSRWPLVAGITATAALNSFGNVFEELLFGHLIRRTKLAEPPLFVLGHWRSGTTLLHELLILDQRHTYPNTYECFAPSHFLWTEWFVPPLLSWLLPSTRPMDNMPAGWERPQEDEFALCNLGIPSPYLVWAFPNHGPVAEDYLELRSLSEADRGRWKRALKNFVSRVALRRNRRIILKSPTHTARVRTLLEVFPDARFVHIVRNPYALFPSTIRLWSTLSQVQGMQELDPANRWIEEQVLATFVRMYEQYERDRELIPAGRLAEVHFEELVADPVGQLRSVYDRLSLGGFERVESAIANYAIEHRGYQANRYQLPPTVADRVRRTWAPYFERYGYTERDVDLVSA